MLNDWFWPRPAHHVRRRQAIIFTPRRFQSGESDNPGHISRAGDADVRSALYVAAHSLLTRNEQWSSLKA